MKDYHNQVFIASLILTAIIFSAGLLVSYGMDYIKVNQILLSVNNQSIDTDAYLIEKDFVGTFGGDNCAMSTAKLYDLKVQTESVGQDLGRYGQANVFKKEDFDYLKRKYFLLELQLYSLTQQLNSECGAKYTTLLFFYKIDDTVSERQGYVLTDLSQAHKNDVFIFTFDIDYKDEPVLNMLIAKYNITFAPTIILDGQKVEGIAYQKQLEAMFRDLSSPVDHYARPYSFLITLNAANISVDDYLTRLRSQNLTGFALGDSMLVQGRLTNNDNLICAASDVFKTSVYPNTELLALSYETIASINCHNESSDYYMKASAIWKLEGDYFRAELDKNLANNAPLNFYYNIENLPSVPKSTQNWDKLIIGNSSLTVFSGEILVSQADRVTRDWLSAQYQDPYSSNLLSVFSEQYTLPENELYPLIGWHEGGRIKELKQAGIINLIASGTIVKKINNTWYAPDEKGVFRFEVPDDKVFYPTTRFFRDDVAMIVDTHGVNMIVEQAIRYKAKVVVACCDNIGKIKAAKYLSDRGIDVICFTDKEVPNLLFSGANVLGSPPMQNNGNSFTIGNRTVVINKDDVVIAMNASAAKYALWYYETPATYFSLLSLSTGLHVEYVSVDDFNQMSKVISAAHYFDSNIIGVRVYNKDDYEKVKAWLQEDNANKAILFHSMSYPYGYKLMEEFPLQTSFDDINPEIIT